MICCTVIRLVGPAHFVLRDLTKLRSIMNAVASNVVLGCIDVSLGA